MENRGAPIGHEALAAKNRVFYVDCIRSTAAFLVVSSHVFAPVCAAMNDYRLFDWWVFNLLDSIIRPSVALFAMISGKLILGSERTGSYFRFVRRRYSRLLLPFFVWSLIYAYIEAWMRGVPISAGHALLQFVQGPTEYHLWFMYVILSLYLIAPFLRRFVQAAQRGEIRILLGMWFLFLVLQFFFPDYAGSGRIVTLLDYAGYFLLGYFLDGSKFFSKKVGWTIFLSLAIVVFNAVGTYFLTKRHGGELDERLYYGVSPLVAVYAALFFLSLKNISYDALLARWPRLRGLLGRLSRESYNLYLIHPFFIWLYTQGHLGFVLSEDTGPTPLVGVPLTVCLVFFSSLGLTLLLKTIPVISRLFVSGPGFWERPRAAAIRLNPFEDENEL